MKHLDDAALLLDASGERTSDHVAGCGYCQKRQAELLAGVHRAEDAWRGEIGKRQPLGGRFSLFWTGAALTAAILVAGVFWQLRPRPYSDQPDRALTPGRVQSGSVQTCLASDEPPVPVSDARAMEVFRRYGIAHPKPGQFEIDYLVPPDLGGSSHPDNLWPQPYHAGVWNSHIKDALEDRLHNLVCSGKLDLATAQKDLMSGWIAAYRKYFATREPLQDHAVFLKDRPWE